jgi:hypothetical protein
MLRTHRRQTTNAQVTRSPRGRGDSAATPRFASREWERDEVSMQMRSPEEPWHARLTTVGPRCPLIASVLASGRRVAPPTIRFVGRCP